MSKSKYSCKLTEASMAMQNGTDYTCCNVNKESWMDGRREVIRVYNTLPKDAFQSPTRKMINTALDYGIPHSSCQHCWDLEESNIESPRQTYNKLLSDVETLDDRPRVLIFKPGNTCNIACRMCNPETSSSWYADSYKLNESNKPPYSVYIKQFERIRKSYNSSNQEFWINLKSWLPDLRYLYIYGGEPYLMPALFDWLKYGVEIGASKNIEIDIHTNGTIDNDEYNNILSRYKHVNFHISIDSPYKSELEYIRYKANYNTVIYNTKNFNNIFKDLENVHTSVTYTVTPFNIFQIDEKVEEIKNITGLEQVNLNFVTTPAEQDIRHLPIPIKELIISETSIQEVIAFLEKTIPGCDIEWPKFCYMTDKLDKIRSQKFKQVFPKWWSILETYWGKPYSGSLQR